MMLSQIPGGPNEKVKQNKLQFLLFIRRKLTRTSNVSHFSSQFKWKQTREGIRNGSERDS